MGYCSLDDLLKEIPEEELIQLTDDEGLGQINQAVVDEAIQDADELIDSFLRGRYSLPLQSVPGLLRRISKEITIYNLHKRRLRREMPEALEQSYQAQLKLLEKIQKGIINLGIESTSGEVAEFRTNKTSEDRVFSKDTLEGF